MYSVQVFLRVCANICSSEFADKGIDSNSMCRGQKDHAGTDIVDIHFGFDLTRQDIQGVFFYCSTLKND